MTSYDDLDDIWTFEPNQRGQSGTTQRYLTISEHEILAISNQSKVPFWARDWIAPALKDRLFCQTDDGPELRTYLILDATARTDITGVFDLDSEKVDVPIRCLFKGDAAEDLKETAPYILDMTLSEDALANDDLVPTFHKDFFQNYWGKNTGVFVRTTASMAEVWNHYRKFTLVTREGHQGRVFVAFWTEQYLRLYFPHIADNKDRVALWFKRDGFAIQAMFGDQDGGAKLVEVTLNHDLFTQANTHPAPFVMTDYDLLPFYQERREKDLLQLINALKEGFPDALRDYAPDAIRQIIADLLERMQGYGFTKKGHLYLLAAWCLFLGQHFEHRDPDGQLLGICKSQMSESDKMAALKQRLAELSPPQKAVS